MDDNVLPGLTTITHPSGSKESAIILKNAGMCSNCGGVDAYVKAEGESDEYTVVMVLPDSKCMCSQVDRVLQEHD